jgi:hypothetical protein
MRNSSDTIGNRIRDLPFRRTVPQPTTPPRAPSALRTSTEILHTIKYQFSYFTLSTRWLYLVRQFSRKSKTDFLSSA